MTSRCSAHITVDAGGQTRAIFESLKADAAFYPSPARVEMDGAAMTLKIGPHRIQHLRANLNSLLRLVQTGHDALKVTD